MKRVYPIILSAILAMALLTGCKKDVGSDGQTNNQSDEANPATQTLTVATPFGKADGHYEQFNALLAGYESQNSVVVENNSADIASEKWKQEVISYFEKETEPDVLFFFNGPIVESLIESGHLISLDEIRAYDSEYAGNISISALNTLREADGRNYCVPVSGYWEGMFINADLFEDCGLEEPSTFDDLLECVAVFRENGIIPVAVNLKTTPHYWFEYLIYSYTGPLFHGNAASEGGNYNRWLKGLELFAALYNAGAFPDDPDEVTDERCLEMFNNKEAAILLGGSWSIGSITDKENTRIADFPAIDGGARKSTDVIGGFSMGYYITAKGWENNREAAVEFVKHMTSDAALEAFNRGGSMSPGSKPMQKTGTDQLTASAYGFQERATAIVPAVQDSFDVYAREYLFSWIIAIAHGEADEAFVLDSFIDLNGR